MAVLDLLFTILKYHQALFGTSYYTMIVDLCDSLVYSAMSLSYTIIINNILLFYLYGHKFGADSNHVLFHHNTLQIWLHAFLNVPTEK